MPVRPRHDLTSTQTIAARVIDHLHEARDLSTTVLAVAREDRRTAEEYLLRFATLFETQPNLRVVHASDPVAAILDEVKADYDLMVLGAPAVNPSDSVVFGQHIDDLIKLSSCPTLVIRGGDTPIDWDPEHGRPSRARSVDPGHQNHPVTPTEPFAHHMSGSDTPHPQCKDARSARESIHVLDCADRPHPYRSTTPVRHHPTHSARDPDQN